MYGVIVVRQIMVPCHRMSFLLVITELFALCGSTLTNLLSISLGEDQHPRLVFDQRHQRAKTRSSFMVVPSSTATAAVLVLAIAVALVIEPPVFLRRWWLEWGLSLEVSTECQTTEHYAVGTGFDVFWDKGALSVLSSSLPQSSSSASPNNTLWHSYAREKPFILAARAVLKHDPIQDGHYFLNQGIRGQTTRQTVESLLYEPNVSLTLIGTLDRPGGPSIPYRFTLSADKACTDGKLHFAILLGETDESQDDDSDDEIVYAGKDGPIPSNKAAYYNRVWLRYGSDKEEAFFGFGQHYSRWNLKGHLVPVIISEQGVGRGLQPATFALNTFLHGVGSAWHTTYVAKPMYLTSRGRALSLVGPKVSFFDLTLPDIVTAEYWSCRSMRGILYSAASPLETVALLSTETGRMQPLPAWTQRGVVVGLEGGSEEVERITARLEAHQVPLVAVWLQDWVGTRQDWDGTRLIWNWEVNRGYYPRWDSFRQRLEASGGVKVLTYINPFLVDVAAANKSFPHTRNLFAEAVEHGHLIKDAAGQPLLAKSGSIEFGTIDASSPETRAWFKTVIKTAMIEGAGAGGWMADFGEYVPFNARLHGGRGNAMHNAFPDYWASLQREAIAEAGGGAAEEVVAFVRSGYMKTPGFAQLYWVGDQLVTWDGHDGIKTVLPAMLSGGLVGHSLTHSDVGGYTMIDHPVLKFFRPRELLFRWVELGAFAGVLFRTHLGSFMHTPSAQVWDDAETMAHFARFGRIFAHLAPYRSVLMEEAASKGYPVVRPLFLHYPGDASAYRISQQFLLGPDLLVAPVLNPGQETLRLYLPGGDRWRHVWTGHIYEGGWLTVSAPMGEIPVFSRQGTPFAELFDSLVEA